MILIFCLAFFGGFVGGGCTVALRRHIRLLQLQKATDMLAQMSDKMDDIELKFHNKESPFNLTQEDCKRTAQFISAVWAFTEIHRKDI